MKAALILTVFLLTLSTFASEKRMSSEASQFYPWQSSSTVCQAATRCMNGRIIACKTFGFNYSNVPSYMANSCRWAVLPGRAVRCQGYTEVRDFYGRFIWTYVDVPVSCF